MTNLEDDRRRAGETVRREVLGAAYVDGGKKTSNAFTQNFLDFTVDQCWSTVWLRPGLERKTRSMLNLAMLSAMGRWHEFEVHVRGALNNGVTSDEITEILLQAGVYAGVPVAAEGFRRANTVIETVQTERSGAENNT